MNKKTTMKMVITGMMDVSRNNSDDIQNAVRMQLFNTDNNVNDKL